MADNPKPKYPETGLYKLTSDNPEAPHPNFRIKKFDRDLNLESSYANDFVDSKGGGYYSCECPGYAKRFKCRHQEIRAAIINANEVNGERFFNFETRTFIAAEEL